MLTRKHILRVYHENVVIAFKRGRHPQGFKGLYLPEIPEIRIYNPSINSIDDRNQTLLHELIHARDDSYFSSRFASQYNRTNDEIEKEASTTYSDNPEIINFILWLFNLYSPNIN